MEFPCTGCGAGLEWKPGGGALTCPRCGTVSEPDPAPAGEIRAYALDEAARSAPRGYGTQTVGRTCGACGAAFDLDPKLTVTSCPFCSSTQVVDHADEGQIRPESVLPFAIEKNDAIRQFRGWLSGLWFRPDALKQAAQLERIHGIYLPAWTFDAAAHSRWTAEAGHHYFVDETYTATVDGKPVEKTRKKRMTRWEPAKGERRGAYADQIVQASGGLDQAALKGLLPFDLGKLRPYDTRFLSGFEAERYKVGLDEAWGIAQNELRAQESSACRAMVPGDTQRNLAVITELSEVRFKHTLLPVWIAAYRYEGRVYRYLVNGDSGKASGEAPISRWKVFFAVAAALISILGCMGLLSLISAIGALIGGS